MITLIDIEGDFEIIGPVCRLQAVISNAGDQSEKYRFLE